MAAESIAVVYLLLFFGALPTMVWWLGGRLDARLAMPPPRGGWVVAGGVLAVAGIGWMVWAMVLLRVVGGGWPISHLPPVRLVTSGPYRWTRHPIYLGYATGFAGLALADGSLGRLLSTAVL